MKSMFQRVTLLTFLALLTAPFGVEAQPKPSKPSPAVQFCIKILHGELEKSGDMCIVKGDEKTYQGDAEKVFELFHEVIK